MATKKVRNPFNQSLTSWKSKIFGIKLNDLIATAQSRLDAYTKNPTPFSAYGKDVRTDWEKAYDLIEGWFFEDLMVEIINLKIKPLNYTAQIIGCDADRVIQIQDSAVSAEPDIGIFNANGELVKTLELKTAHQWFNELHIKDSNIENLKKHPLTSLVFWSLESNEICILELSEFINRPTVPNPHWNNKPCYKFTKNEMKSKMLGKPHQYNWGDLILRSSQSLGQEVRELGLKKL